MVVLISGIVIVLAGALWWRAVFAGQTSVGRLAGEERNVAGDFSVSATALPLVPSSAPKTITSYDQRLTHEEIMKTLHFLIESGAKLIEINLSTQTMATWEKGRAVMTTLISTGRTGKDTAPGVWKVLDKYPIAYGEGLERGVRQVWGMPYWMGIYMVGDTENGIHELPFINGYREGSRSLGHRVSHGCVRVPQGTAKVLYDWSELDTPVVIHY